MTALINTAPQSAPACSWAPRPVLVAPVRLGDGAFVAAGSVVTRDVAPDAMAFGRAQQVDKPGRAAAFRAGKEKALGCAALSA